ncbi:hypothetical protein Cgig2_004570 [Carnegiea gigantea]|uniref:Uncharacterized protein n=1 Tax=Carnegiea gigantea TaxID=171969 RepID=A0A9Q1GP50_9CARY|nr:hypothetical protein Cgig2_004570 [Carnegiea gigantea]
MKEHQTPRKDLAHRRSKDSPSSKSISGHVKKTPKTAKKSLNAEFTSVSEDLLSESVTESFNFSPISEVLSDKHNGESIDSSKWLFPGEYSSIPAIEEALTLSDSASSSKITSVKDETYDSSADRPKIFGNNSNVEAEMVSNLLKQATLEVLSSSDIHSSSKKVLDALVEVSVREFHALPDEDDKIDFLILNRSRILAFSFVVWLMISLINSEPLGSSSSSITAIEEILTPSYSASSSRITISNDETCDSSVDNCKGLGDNSTVETEMVSNLLKQAGVEVLSSSEIHPSSKKVLDALTEVSVREFYVLPDDEDDKVDFLISSRSRILAFVCCGVVNDFSEYDRFLWRFDHSSYLKISNWLLYLCAFARMLHNSFNYSAC